MPVIQHLRELVDAQLVNAVSADAFAFRHALTCEAVYATILKRQRTAYHALVAEALEEQYSSEAQLASHAADLAYHYREAANWAKALEYAQQAGEHAQKLYAPREAAEHFSHAIEAAGQLGQPPDLRLLRGRGQAYETLAEFDRARADYELGLSLAGQAGAAQAEWQALLDLGFLWAGRDYARTGEYFQQALERARTTGDPLTIAHSLNRVGLWLANIGRAAEGLQRHHEALGIFREHGAPAEIAATHDLLGLGYTLLGDVPAGKEQTEQAIELFRRAGDKRGLISSLAAHSALMSNCDTLPGTGQTAQSCRQEALEALALARQIGWLAGQAEVQWLLGVTLGGYGEFGEALVRANAARQLATDIEHREWTAAAHCMLGQIHLWLLEPETAAHLLEIARRFAVDLSSYWWISYISTFMAQAQLQLGQARAAQVELRQAADSLGMTAGWETRAPRGVGERNIAWAWGETALANGQPAEALVVADLLINTAINPGGEPIPNLLKLKAEALLALGQLAEAQSTLDLALLGARQRGARPTLWQIHRDRGWLEQRLGRPDKAEREFAAARGLVEELASTLEEGPLRQRFLSRAMRQVRQVNGNE